MMNWTSLLSRQRFEIQEQDISPTSATSQQDAQALRTDFHIDYDRVVFCGSFRRLGRKTQVHPFAQNDHTHNRLTHSVEVASVGRSLGNRVGVMMQHNHCLPDGYSASDIGSVVQVACLAHDMGNPPFGHMGEDALRDWFKQPENVGYLNGLSDEECLDIQTYEGNAHTLRIVSTLEMYRQSGGMRLTAASIGTLMKYPWTSSHPQWGQKKFNIYQTELMFIRRIAHQLQLIENGTDCWCRHPLSYLMEAADDICYALLDLEDAVEIGLITEHDMENTLSPLASANTWNTQTTERQRCAMLRGLAIGRAIESISEAFMRHHDDLLRGEFSCQDLLTVASAEVHDTLIGAKELARNRVFSHPNKVVTEIASFPCLGAILSLLVPAAYRFVHQQKINHRDTLALKLLENPIHSEDSLYTAYMKVLDFVGAMTDNTAAKLAREISGIGMA